MTESSDVEDMRRYLEDTLTLLRTADAPVVNYSDELDDEESLPSFRDFTSVLSERKKPTKISDATVSRKLCESVVGVGIRAILLFCVQYPCCGERGKFAVRLCSAILYFSLSSLSN
jgi:hypothetical protein